MYTSYIFLAKYSKDGEIKWANAAGGNHVDTISSVTETIDGGCIAVGGFYSESIDLGNGIVLSNNGNTGNSNGMIIKYSAEGEVEWGKTIGEDGDDCITSICKTTDGGYTIVGNFYSKSINLGNDIILNNNGYRDDMIIRYNAEGEVEWAKIIGGDGDEFTSFYDKVFKSANL